MSDLCTCGDPPAANYYTCVTYSVGDSDVTYAYNYTCSEHTVVLDNWHYDEDTSEPDVAAVCEHFGLDPAGLSVFEVEQTELR